MTGLWLQYLVGACLQANTTSAETIQARRARELRRTREVAEYQEYMAARL